MRAYREAVELRTESISFKDEMIMKPFIQIAVVGLCLLAGMPTTQAQTAPATKPSIAGEPAKTGEVAMLHWHDTLVERPENFDLSLSTVMGAGKTPAPPRLSHTHKKSPRKIRGPYQMRTLTWSEEAKHLELVFDALREMVKSPFQIEFCKPGAYFEPAGLQYNCRLRHTGSKMLFLLNITLGREHTEWDAQIPLAWFSLEEGEPVGVNRLSLKEKITDAALRQLRKGMNLHSTG